MIDPVIFSIGGLNFYWYGAIYSISFLFSYFFLMYFRKKVGFSKEKLENIFLFTMIFAVLGGRVGYILFYDPVHYLTNLVEIFRVDKGGMSIHGGFLGGLFSLMYFSKKYNIKLLKMTDFFVVPLGFGLALGRLANFINQELVGKITDSSLGMVFESYDNQNRWPYQIFVSFKNLIVFEVLFFLFMFKKLKTGLLTAWFLILYNGGRFVLDFFREPTIAIGILSMGQILCLIFGGFGIYLLFRISKEK